MATITKNNKHHKHRDDYVYQDFAKEVREFYHTDWWYKASQSILMKADYLCQDCLKEEKLTLATEVHHIKPIPYNSDRWRDFAYDYENLIALCHECHQRRHHVSFYDRKERMKKYLV